MHSSRFQTITARLSPAKLRTSFRRSSSTSSRTASSSSTRSSIVSSHSPVETINSVILRQPSIANLEAERKSFGSELDILEPRPIVYWGSVEERMGTFPF
ncbi:hypothetical protein MKZ38_005668 [Zalerion maritima]|uniref:Calcium channel subunit cch1 n=1 Tax=Zalerion maritima TaxID=339359 RepID=A0AAD5WUR2_9PEZI|nr:hypothetical protein MKZ38_005668 [Zalerion maritima]